MLEILEGSEGEWSTSCEISQNVDASRGSVLLALKRLRMQGVVERRRDPAERYGFQYRYNARSANGETGA